MYSKEKIYKVFDEIIEESKLVKPYVCICQPRRDLNETPAQNFDSHNYIHIDLSGYSRSFANIGGEKVDVARNYLIEEAIASGAKYLFFIGEDTIIPWNGFLKLHETAEANPDAMIIGVYYIKLSVPMIMVKEPNGWIKPSNVDPGQVYEIWQGGLDCALIPTKILKDIKERDPEIPFCCIKPSTDPKGFFIGEDNMFYYLLRKYGYKILVNTDVQCLHADLMLKKFTAHPSLTDDDIKKNYFTNFPLEGRLEWSDKETIDKRWVERLPKEKTA